MKFKPQSDEEMNKGSGLLKEGEGTFDVLFAEDTVSKANNQMIKLQLKVWDSEGSDACVFDFLLSNAQWKLKHFLEAIGQEKSFESGVIVPDNLIGASGNCKIFTQKDKSGKYDDHSAIKDYIKADKSKPVTPKSEPKQDDDIPF